MPGAQGNECRKHPHTLPARVNMYSQFTLKFICSFHFTFILVPRNSEKVRLPLAWARSVPAAGGRGEGDGPGAVPGEAPCAAWCCARSSEATTFIQHGAVGRLASTVVNSSVWALRRIVRI